MNVEPLTNLHNEPLTKKTEDWEWNETRVFYWDLRRHTEENEANIKKVSRKLRKQEMQQSGTEMDLQGGHVIESMVQLLRDGFILQLLSIEFIWRSVGKAGNEGWEAAMDRNQKEKEKDKKLMDIWRLNMLKVMFYQ